MHRRHFAPWLFLLLTFLACGWASASNSAPAPPKKSKQAVNTTPVARPAAGAVAKLAESSNAFGFDLYQRLRLKQGNLVISPASVTTALTMAWGGAEGETAAQMRKVLHLEGSASEILDTSGQLARSLQDPSRPIVFRIANQLFVEKTYKLEPDYLDRSYRAFGAPVELLDLKKASENSRVHVNRWVEGKTERLVLGEVFHKGFVRVDEKGTEAAAATVGGIPTGASAGSPSRRVNVNRPFLFLIRDNASGLVLFLGRVSDPSR